MQPQRQTGAGRVRLGELLVKAGVITDAQLKTALLEQKQFGGKLGDILVRMRYLSEDVFVRALSKQLGLQRADLSGQTRIPPEALARIPPDFAEEYEIVPYALADEGKTIIIATSDPLNLTVLDAVRSVTGLRVLAYVAGASQIRAAIARLYQHEEVTLSEAGQLRILANAEDAVVAQATENANRGMSTPVPRGPPTPPPAPFAPVPAVPPGMQVAVPGMPPIQLAPAPMPAGYPNAYYPPPFAAPTPLPGTVPAYAQPAAVLPEDSQRREAAAIRALVELLVQKGVISLDEYLARLKR